MPEPDKILDVEITTGHVLKIIVEAITSTSLQRAKIVFGLDGIKMCQADDDSVMLYDINLPKEHFRKYYTRYPIAASFNLKHLKGILKNVKKKDSINLHIDEGGECMYVTVRPNNSDTRHEKNNIVFYPLSDYDPDMPPEEAAYGQPVVTPASDFQKIKRLIASTNSSKQASEITIKIQGSNYICFKSGSKLYGSEIVVGTPIAPRTDYVPEEDDLNEGYIDEEYLSNDEIDAIYGADTHTFERQYQASRLGGLAKLSALCSNMKFYAPNDRRYPLRIKVDAVQNNTFLGTVQVYIKDIQQIEYERAAKERDIVAD